MSQIPKRETDPVQRICTICQQPAGLLEHEIDPDRLHEYTDGPCPECKQWTKEGNYIFVSISNKSEPPTKIKRTGFCWKVELEAVREEFDDDHEVFQSSDNIIFVRTNEAVALDLLTEKQAEQIEDHTHDGPIET